MRTLPLRCRCVLLCGDVSLVSLQVSDETRASLQPWYRAKPIDHDTPSFPTFYRYKATFLV